MSIEPFVDAYRSIVASLAANDSLARVLSAGQVHAFGVGYKRSMDREHASVALRFHVPKKVPLLSLARRARIPAMLAGIVTDVIESSPSFAHAVDPRDRVDPVRPGVSIAGPAAATGTLGALVRDASGQAMILTASHVARTHVANQREISQPSPFDHPSPLAIASTARAEPAQWPVSSLTVDAAVAKLAPSVAFDARVLEIGPPGTPVEPSAALGQSVVKFGRSTEKTLGKVTEYPHHATLRVRIGGANHSVAYRDQLFIESQNELCADGDSGALWMLARTLEAVALHCGGGSNRKTAVATPIGRVLATLGVTLA
ncbi:MAG: hypothetical protein JNK05_04430 [Myxococcales bacterium]|nr:hypothetical protein [Myxococcales bacterium]